MYRQVEYDNKTGSTGGCRDDGGLFVANVSSFIVTDDLRVMPNTSGFTIQVLFEFGITDASQIEERTFDIGHEQVIRFLYIILIFSLFYGFIY